MGTRRNYQRTSNKNDSPLHVLPVAEKLIDYTLDLTDNAKRFPKRVRSKTFIYDNYASQKGKGTHFGLDRLKYFMSRYYRQNGADGWVLKCDIRK